MAAKKKQDPSGEKATANPGGVDRVAMTSVRADGTVDQTPGYEIIGDGEDVPVEERHSSGESADNDEG